MKSTGWWLTTHKLPSSTTDQRFASLSRVWEDSKAVATYSPWRPIFLNQAAVYVGRSIRSDLWLSALWVYICVTINLLTPEIKIEIASSFQIRGSGVFFWREEKLAIGLCYKSTTWHSLNPDIIHFKSVDRFDRFFFDLIYERIALRVVSGLWGISPLIRFRDKDCTITCNSYAICSAQNTV